MPSMCDRNLHCDSCARMFCVFTKLRTELLMTVIYCTSAFITMFMDIYRDVCRIELSESGNSYFKELNFQAKSCRPYAVI